jgi:hypothetical protein
MSKRHAKEPEISGREIHRRVIKRLAAYDDLNHFGRVAFFIGKAQILEFGLKGLLARHYNYQPDDVEKWTLGRTTHELEHSGLRGDFIALLKVVVKYRNHIAHEYLAGMAMLSVLLRGNTGRLGIKHLQRGTYELERVILLYDWCEKHEAWELKESFPTPDPMPAQ